jgi:hypothetical protein
LSLHDETEQIVRVIFTGLRGKLLTCSRDREYAKQVGVADRTPTAVNEYPHMKNEIAMEGSILLQPGSYKGEGLRGTSGEASLGQERSQLFDLSRIADGNFFQLNWLQHTDQILLKRVPRGRQENRHARPTSCC